MKKIVLFITILSLITLMSGCLGITMYTKIMKDGNVSDMKIEINTTSYVYGLMQSSAQQQGYATVKEYMLSNVSKEYGSSSMGGNTFDYNEEWSGDNVKMTLTAKGSFKPGDPIKIYRDGNYMIFEYAPTASPTPTPTPTPNPYGYSFNDSYMSNLSDAMLSGITFNYYLEMPGKIVDSNANAVNGNKAEWHLTGKTMSGMKMYARSEVPAAAPGFEALLAIASIFAGYCLVASRKKEN
jgi:hypothetical protein